MATNLLDFGELPQDFSLRVPAWERELYICQKLEYKYAPSP